jgi:hypothetical protein
MPEHIEKRLSKRIRKYMWKDEKNHSPVGESTLQAPIEEGGKGLLDLKARNEAIQVMWLKRYLDLSPNRGMWALFADAIYAIKTPKSEKTVDREVRTNVFLQSWKTSTGHQTEILKDLRDILQVSEKYGARPEGLAFSRDILREMPIWYHREGDKKLRKLNHSKASDCLRDKHKIRTVGHAMDTAAHGEEHTHRKRSNCACATCKKTRRETGCTNLNTCFKRAKELMDTHCHRNGTQDKNCQKTMKQ